MCSFSRPPRQEPPKAEPIVETPPMVTKATTTKDAPKKAEPETISIQCDMCGSMLKIRKPTKARYSVTCSYPECGNVMSFD